MDRHEPRVVEPGKELGLVLEPGAAGAIGAAALVEQLRTRSRLLLAREQLETVLPERTSMQQAQGAARPLHVWPGEGAQEMALQFDELLQTVLTASGRGGGEAASGRKVPAPTAGGDADAAAELEAAEAAEGDEQTK